MSMVDIHHAYAQFYGLYSDVNYDDPPTITEDEILLDAALLPAPTYLDKPLCSACKEVNLSLRDERCIQCRIGLRQTGLH